MKPATHARVNARPGNDRGRLPGRSVQLEPAGAWRQPARRRARRQPGGGRARAARRLAKHAARLDLERAAVLHSAFPTNQSDAVFFGPDTYRFAAVDTYLAGGRTVRRAVDIGCGAGPGTGGRRRPRGAQGSALVERMTNKGDIRTLTFARSDI